jgi:cytochrome c-type biogenesis protein CcmH/NrfG
MASADARHRGLRPVIKYAAAGVAALGLVVAGVWFIASPRQSEPIRPAVASATVPAPARPAPGASLVKERAAVGGANQRGPDSAEVEAKVQELKSTGNWNMLVIYATEWTRNQPTSGAAWHELSVGYLNLHQLGDALDAAKRAVQLAPDNASLWSDLGRINLTVQRSTDASIAFDRALALSPDDTDALCGAASAAQQQGRRSDAEAFSKRVKTEAACRDASDGTSVASVVAPSATRKAVSPPGR